ncbi:RNAi component RdRP [Acrasis kona]|uniref:RNA-dependent RNA polymerase n=1 Tax=Acrasis kona TaxID=1008807 RepID=A0AAW2YK56_9EUKA
MEQTSEVFLRNLNYCTTQLELVRFFNERGAQVTNCKMMKGGKAVLKFSRVEDASSLVNQSPIAIRGRPVYLKSNQSQTFGDIHSLKATTICFCNLLENSIYHDCAIGASLISFNYFKKRITITIDDDGTCIYRIHIPFNEVEQYFMEGEFFIVKSRHVGRIVRVPCRNTGTAYSGTEDDQEQVCELDVQDIEFGNYSAYMVELNDDFDDAIRRLSVEIKSFKPNDLNYLRAIPYDLSSLPFNRQFKLMCAVHKGLLNSSSLSEEVVEYINKLNARQFKNLATYICKLNKSIALSVDELEKIVKKYGKRNLHAVPTGCIEIKKVAITPTRTICFFDEIVPSNRVLREFDEYKHEFLRVTFCDENLKKLTQQEWTIEGVTDRISTILQDGFSLCGKTFTFLAGSGSQLKENSCYFFSNNEHVTADMIREKMGNFENMTSGAKYYARMAQCFSDSTTAVELKKEEMIEVDDLKTADGAYLYTDGAGTASKEIFDDIVSIRGAPQDVSVVQIRCGGCKGTLTLDSSLQGRSVHFSKSMKKFVSPSTHLEILKYSQFSPSYLNRQIITLLSSLGADDDSFQALQNEFLCKVLNITSNHENALKISKQTCSSFIYRMLVNHVPVDEPFLSALLHTLRVKQLKELKKRSRILVEKGASLIGTFDHTNTLGEDEVYVCPSSNNKEPYVGPVIVTKSPCLHPGDIRFLKAVDNSLLRHHTNCIVFPIKGERPIQTKCSNGDLDGDIYWVTWDERIFPTHTASPMESNKTSSSSLDPFSMINLLKFAPFDFGLTSQVDLKSVKKFFVDYITNDVLGVVAQNWLALADEHKALHPKCVQLADLHQVAVSYEKSGIPAKMTKDLRAEKYPDFMENQTKKMYESNQIIGVLFRQVRGEYEKYARSHEESQSQSRIVGNPLFLKYSGTGEFMDEAKEFLSDYNSSLQSIMNQYGIDYESEVVTGNILHFTYPSSSNDYQVVEKVTSMYKTLYLDYLDKFNQGDLTEEQKYAKACAWYKVVYSPEKKKNNKRRLFSFAWIGVEFLGKIINNNKN